METLKLIGEIIVALIVLKYVIRCIKSIIHRYNRLSLYRVNLRTSRANIDASVAKRNNTLNQLYQIADTFMHHEGNIINTATLAQHGKGIPYLQALATAYPTLTSNHTFSSLMSSVQNAEFDIQLKFEKYNEAVNDYQVVRSSFPNNMLAPLLGFKKGQYLTKEELSVESTYHPPVIATANVTTSTQPIDAKPVQTTTEVSTDSQPICPQCHSPLKRLKNKYGNTSGYYWRCSNNNCKADYSDEDGQPVIQQCPQCHKGYLHKRTLAGKDYWTCSEHPQCKAKYLYLPAGSGNTTK